MVTEVAHQKDLPPREHGSEMDAFLSNAWKLFSPSVDRFAQMLPQLNLNLNVEMERSRSLIEQNLHAQLEQFRSLMDVFIAMSHPHICATVEPSYNDDSSSNNYHLSVPSVLRQNYPQANKHAKIHLKVTQKLQSHEAIMEFKSSKNAHIIPQIIIQDGPNKTLLITGKVTRQYNEHGEHKQEDLAEFSLL